jgi:Putative Ig domain
MSIRHLTRRVAVGSVVAATAGLAAVLTLGSTAWADPPAGSQLPGSAVPISSFTAGTPFSSGQIIKVLVPANSTFASGSNIEIVECSVSVLSATTDSQALPECDGLTINGDTVDAASDGSVSYSNYTAYALPDVGSLGESPSGTPVCNLTNLCVLYIGNDETHPFSSAHFFSQTFAIQPRAGDTGTPAGDGFSRTQAITFNSNPPNPAIVGSSYLPAATGGGSGNPVVFSHDAASTAGTCSVAGGVVSFTDLGTCVIDANQAAGSPYLAAPTVMQSFTITNVGFYITTVSLPPATRGASYGPVQLMATGGNQPFKWKVIGKLPKGMKFAKSSATIQGTPKAKHVSAGTYNIQVQVQSKKTKTMPKQTATRSFTLVLN